MPWALMLALFFGTFLSEDLACIAAGVLIAQKTLGTIPGLLACTLGIFIGDLLLYLCGVFIRNRTANWRWLRSLHRESLSMNTASQFTSRGFALIVLSRFTPGLRLPTYVSAGILNVPFGRFSAWLGLASLAWTPLLVLSSARLGKEASEMYLRDFRWTPLILLAVWLAFRAFTWLIRSFSSWENRRVLLGKLLKWVRWEFWPPWIAYLPLTPYLLFLTVRYRSLTVFTCANPGIPSSGLTGESKSEILRHLSRNSGAVPVYTVLQEDILPERMAKALAFLMQNRLEYPVVVKPDKGQRGRGVAVIRDQQQLKAYLDKAQGDIILQEYAPGLEFGVYYCRYPGEEHGKVVSITEKQFPQVCGDGVKSVYQLILSDFRAVSLAGVYRSVCPAALHSVPAEGERVAIAELGSHCRGSVFVDSTHLITPALEQVIDKISHSHPGFFLGRYDLRAPNQDALREGRDLRILELNGITAEPVHIYDPKVSIWDAYRALAWQWRTAFEIGCLNSREGHRAMSIRELVVLLRLQHDAY